MNSRYLDKKIGLDITVIDSKINVISSRYDNDKNFQKSLNEIPKKTQRRRSPCKRSSFFRRDFLVCYFKIKWQNRKIRFCRASY